MLAVAGPATGVGGGCGDGDFAAKELLIAEPSKLNELDVSCKHARAQSDNVLGKDAEWITLNTTLQYDML